MQLVSILLDRYEATGIAHVPVTERVLGTVLQNKGCGGVILQLLLNRRNADVKIYPQIREMLAFPIGVSDRAMTLLLAERHTEIDLDEQFIADFAVYASGTEMKILLSTLNDDFLLTENVLVNAARNRVGVDALLQILRRRQLRAQVSESVLCAAACQGDLSHSLEMLGVFLDECGLDSPISEKVMLRVLDDQLQQFGFNVTRAILRKTASHPFARDFFEIFMNNGGLRIPITEDIMLEAQDDDLMCFLLDLEEMSQIHALPFTGTVILHSVEIFDPANLKIILRRRPTVLVSDDMFVASCRRDISTLSLLMEQPHSQLPVERMNEISEGQDDQGTTEIFRFLLDKKLFEVDQRIIERFAHSASIFVLLLQTTPRVAITEQAVIRAAPYEYALCILLDERIEDAPISERVMIAVVRATCSVANLQWILAHFGTQVPITEKVLVAASYTFDALRLLLQAIGSNIPPPLTEKVVVLATYKGLSALP
ncbi:hypothetical protein BDV19DRAFT_391284 [Aspergillus venezuelensis]